MYQKPTKIERRKFTSDERDIILRKTNYKCAHCGCKLDQSNMTVDHVFPIYHGGLHDEYNLLPLCYECNEIKSNFVYALDDFYKNISDEYYDIFDKYFTFASFEYGRQSILGYDDKLFTYIPDKIDMLAQQMLARGTKRSKVYDLVERNKASIIMRRAYPAAAKSIFAMMQKHVENKNYFINETIYTCEFDVLQAIENGVVYVLEHNHKICGCFIFEKYRYVAKDAEDYIQLQNVLDASNLKLKYIMTYATADNFGYNVFSDVMQYLNQNQIMNGWMPLYFNILRYMYVDKDKCIQLPHTFKDVNGCLEFMPLKELLDKEDEYARSIFMYHGYELDDFDIRRFSEYNVKYLYQYEIDEDPEAHEFFEKYADLRLFFKPDTYEYYDVGFVTKI